MNAPAKKDIPKIIATLNPLVNAVLMLKAKAAVLRERADAIQAEILQRDKYVTEDGERVTTPNLSYRIQKSQWAHFYAEIDRAYKEAGYNLEPGQCFALIAEHELSGAENALIIFAGQFFHVDKHTLICNGMEAYRKYLDLLIKLVISHPNYRKPEMAR